jgi:drug/metabolite transporter (DMT)-like permease
MTTYAILDAERGIDEPREGNEIELDVILRESNTFDEGWNWSQKWGYYFSLLWKKAKYPLVMTSLVLGFIGSNSALNFGNGYVFKETGFKFPVLMTSFHALLGGLLGVCYMKMGQNRSHWIRFRWITTRKQAFVVLLTGAFFALNVGFNNASYQYISVTLNQSIRSLNTVFTAIFCVAIQEKKFSLPYWLGIFVISIGVAMSVYGNPVFNTLGIVFALVSSVCASLMVTLVGYLTQNDDQETKMDSINTIVWTSLPIFAFCMPFFLWYEFTGLVQYSKTSAINCLGILLITGLIAFFYNLFHYELITFTGSVYSTVVGNLKVVFIFLVVAIYTPTSEGEVPLTTLNKWGIVVTVLDFVYMSFISYRESRLTVAANNRQTH